MCYSLQIMSFSYLKKVSLAKHCTLRIGGQARFFSKIKSQKDLLKGLQFAKEKKIPVFILGHGSNVVIKDGEFAGLVMKMEIKGMKFYKNGEAKIGAGVSWDKFVEEAVKRNLGGAECLSAIPGTVGTAPVQNIGAYGVEVESIIKEVHAIDRNNLKEVILRKKDLGFEYRKSIFNTKNKNRYIITEVIFELIPEGKPYIVYEDLINYFAGKNPTLQEVREAVVEIRTKKGHVAPDFVKASPSKPLIHRSVGSFFKNPIVTKKDFEKIKDKVKNKSGNWFWETDNKKIKISGARLIEEAGFEKGQIFGNVGISPFHSLVLVTYKNATSSELLDLADEIRKKIKSRFNIQLDIEPEII